MELRRIRGQVREQRLISIDCLEQYEIGKIRYTLAVAGLLQSRRQLLAADVKQSRQLLKKPLQRLLASAV